MVDSTAHASSRRRPCIIDASSRASTTLAGGVSRQARTDATGRYTVTVPGGDGDHFGIVAAIGYAARRVEIKRVADEDIRVAGAKLSRTAGVRLEQAHRP